MGPRPPRGSGVKAPRHLAQSQVGTMPCLPRGTRDMRAKVPGRAPGRKTPQTVTLTVHTHQTCRQAWRGVEGDRHTPQLRGAGPCAGVHPL